MLFTYLEEIIQNVSSKIVLIAWSKNGKLYLGLSSFSKSYGRGVGKACLLFFKLFRLFRAMLHFCQSFLTKFHLLNLLYWRWVVMPKLCWIAKFSTNDNKNYIHTNSAGWQISNMSSFSIIFIRCMTYNIKSTTQYA